MSSSCVIYARYSSDNQSEHSIDDQVRICRARAEREGWQVVINGVLRLVVRAVAGRA